MALFLLDEPTWKLPVRCSCWIVGLDARQIRRESSLEAGGLLFFTCYWEFPTGNRAFAFLFAKDATSPGTHSMIYASLDVV